MPKPSLTEWTNARSHAMGEAMERIFLNVEGRALEEGQPFQEALNAGFEAGCECIAAQLNVLIGYYGQARLKADRATYGGSSHYEFMAELLDDVRRRALARNLMRGERHLA